MGYAEVIDRIRVLLHSLGAGKGSIQSIWELIRTAIGYISATFAFAVLLNDLLGFEKLATVCKSYWWGLLIICIVASFIYNREKTSFKKALIDCDFQIAVKTGNLFAEKASSFVIPTNTFFRTIMKNEYISSHSVQGVFQQKYFRDKEKSLDVLIAQSLKQQNVNSEDSADAYGTVKKYPLGTVAKVDHKGKHYYFLAINDVNKYGKPENQNDENVDNALRGLIKSINTIGHCDNIAMPLIGTGRAAIRGATREKVAEKIIDSFLATNEKTARSLTICINPKDYLDGIVDLRRIEKYLEYKCEFAKK